MRKKIACIMIAGAAAAAGGAVLGWTVTNVPSLAQPATMMATSAPIQTAAIGEREPPAPALQPSAPAPKAEVPAPAPPPTATAPKADVPAPAPAANAPAEEPKARMEPSDASIDTEKGLFRLDTPTTKVSLDPKRGSVRFKTPYGSINLDGDKRQARLDASRLYLGIGW